jgi:hypothetical protein
VPHGDGDEVADDSIFENDPFFQLPDQGEDSDGAEQESKGMFKKRKDKKGDDKAARKKEAVEEEKLRKATEREQLKLLMMSDNADEQKRAGFSIKHGALGRASQQAGEALDSKKKNRKKGKKGKKADEDDDEPGNTGGDFEVNVNDSRFSSVFSDPRFALDPTDPQFRKTPGLEKLLHEGRNRRSKRARDEDDASEEEVRGGSAESNGPMGTGLAKRDGKSSGAKGTVGEGGGGSGGASVGKKGRVLDPQLAALVSTLKARGGR